MERERLWASSMLAMVLLVGCVASRPPPPPLAEMQDASSAEASCTQEGSCLTLVCGQDACAFYPCEEVLRHANSVMQVRGVAPLVNSAPAWRFWGAPTGLPESLEPVFVIPWKFHDRRELLPSQEKLLAQWEERLRRPHEKHHIFPQEFKRWFEQQGIPIHHYTVLVDKELHDRIHRGPSGGPWNAAWREFQKASPINPPEKLWAFAWELCVKFGIYGPVLPYYRRFTPLPPAIGF